MTITSRILASLAKLPPVTSSDVSVERDLPVKMSDGIILLADRWHPTGAEDHRVPVILMRTPYGRRQWAGIIGRHFSERGYQVIIQSCRGTFGSGGEWVPFRNEQADGRVTLDWMVEQPWFSGKLATFGPSYLGLTQWALAQDAPDYLQAMALDVTASNFREAVVYPSECFALGTSLAWLRALEYQEEGWRRLLWAQRHTRQVLTAAYGVLPVGHADEAAVGRHVPFFQDWLEHEDSDDGWWSPVDFGRQLANVPPASLVGGWYDIFLPSQLDDYHALRAAGRTVRLTVGPWSHTSPGVMAASMRDGLEWFDGHFNRGSRASLRTGVRLLVMGTRRWVEFPDWPPPSEEHLWYLGAAGTLRRSAPGDSPPDCYRYDPGRSDPGNRWPITQRARRRAEGSVGP
jgi:putative CocE/NonD family hydrolase